MVSNAENRSIKEVHQSLIVPPGFRATHFIFSGRCFEIDKERVIIKNGSLILKTILPVPISKNNNFSVTPFKIKLKIDIIRRVDIIDDSKLTQGATAFALYFSNQTAVKIVKAINDQAGPHFLKFHYENCFFAFEVMHNWNRDRIVLTQLMDAIQEIVTQSKQKPFADYKLNYIDKNTFDKLVLWAGYKLQLGTFEDIVTFQFKITEIPKSSVTAASQVPLLPKIPKSSNPALNRSTFDNPPQKAPPPSGYKVHIRGAQHETFTHEMLCEFFFNGWANDSMLEFGITRIMERFDSNVLDRVVIAPSSYFGRVFRERDLAKKGLSEAETQIVIEKAYSIMRSHGELNDAFEKHFLFFPTYFNYHWNLVVVVNPVGPILTNAESNSSPDCQVIVLDSLLSDVSSDMDNMHRSLVSWVSYYLKLHYSRRQPLNFLPFGQYNRARVSRYVPYCLQQQDNADDCGLFTLFFLEQFLKHITEIQTTVVPRIEEWNMPTFDSAALRQELVFAILDQNNVDKDWFKSQLKRPAYLNPAVMNPLTARPVEQKPAAYGNVSNTVPYDEVKLSSKLLEAATCSNSIQESNLNFDNTTKPMSVEINKPNASKTSSLEAVKIIKTTKIESAELQSVGLKEKFKQSQKPKVAESVKPTGLKADVAKSFNPVRTAPKTVKVANSKLVKKSTTLSEEPAPSTFSATQKRSKPPVPTFNIGNAVPQKRKKPEVIRGFCRKLPARPAPAVGQTLPVFLGTMGLEAEHEEAESGEE